jgi:hypothetical protein
MYYILVASHSSHQGAKASLFSLSTTASNRLVNLLVIKCNNTEYSVIIFSLFLGLVFVLLVTYVIIRVAIFLILLIIVGLRIVHY